MDQFLKQIGKYKIESHLGLQYLTNNIGRGAFGVVYKCKNKETNEIVAIKTLRRITKTSQKLLKSEIEVLKTIDCINVVKMIESFTDKLPYDPLDYEFLVMEYCESNLLDYVFNKKNHALEEKEALDIFAQILNGFQSIHEKGIMHRDLKLENVLIKDGIVKIADFGLAKKVEASSNEHMTRSFCGTKAYLAPEILMGNYYDYKVDIWSLGVLLFVMLFFKFPFGSRQDNPIELLKRIRNCCEEQPFDVDLFINNHFKNKILKAPIDENILFIQQQIQTLQNQKENNQQVEQKSFEISDELKDLFKRIFVIKPEERIGFQELLQHPALKKQMENIEQKLDFYGNKFPTLFKYQSELLIQTHNHSDSNDKEVDSNGSQDDQNQNKQKINQQNAITTGQVSSIMMVRSSTIRYNMKNTSQFKTHIMIYNHLICRYQMLIIAYQQIQQGWLIELLGQKEYTVLKYFLLKCTLYYLQNLKYYLDEADNSFDLKEWPTFVNCKAFKNIKAQIEQDLKKWLPEYHLLSEEVQDYEYDSEDIKKGVCEEIPQKIDIEIYINSMPNNLKLPFRGVVLTIFSKVYEFAAKCFSKMNEMEIQLLKMKETQIAKQQIQSPKLSPQLNSKNKFNSPLEMKNKPQQFFQASTNLPQQNKNSNFTNPKPNSKNSSQINSNNSHNFSLNQSTNISSSILSYSPQQNSPLLKQSHTSNSYNQKLLILKINNEEQFGLKSIRMALLLLCCGVINRVFEIPSCTIRLREFQPHEINYNINNQQETFKFEDLVEWFYQVSKDQAYKQIELLVNSYFKQISSQLYCNSSEHQQETQNQKTQLTNNNNNQNTNLIHEKHHHKEGQEKKISQQQQALKKLVKPA